MKTLYVTDLDGTLLNSNREVSKNTIDGLNKLIDQGILFTVATARTPATVVPLLDKININLPVIVMNGSFIYDIQQSKYIYTSQIPYKSVKKIVGIVEERKKQIFIYTLKHDMLTVYHKGFNSKEEEKFCSERSELKLKKFINVESYNLESEDRVGHMVMIDTYEVIKEIMELVKKIDSVHPVMYRDVNTENSYLLEIAPAQTNKGKGIEKLVDKFGINNVVAFGDNLNDKEMLEMADCSCVVENGEETIKSCADYIIESNDQHGVVKFINSHFSKDYLDSNTSINF